MKKMQENHLVSIVTSKNTILSYLVSGPYQVQLEYFPLTGKVEYGLYIVTDTINECVLITTKPIDFNVGSIINQAKKWQRWI